MGNDVPPAGQTKPLYYSTLGSVWHDLTPQYYILSCGHCGDRNAIPNTAVQNDSIIQPGPQNIGDTIRPAYEIAKWWDGIQELNLNNSQDNPQFGDGSLSLIDLNSSGLVTEAQANIANIGPYAGVTQPIYGRGTRIEMMSATSWYRSGEILSPHATVPIATVNNKVIWYGDVIEVNIAHLGGDSGGSLLTNEQCPRIVGTHFGGILGFPVAFSTPIKYLLNDPNVLNQVDGNKIAPEGGCVPNHATTINSLAQSNINPDGSLAVDPATAEGATPDMWNKADINPDPQEAIDQANGEAVLARNSAVLTSLPGYGSSYVAGDHAGRISNGRLITTIIVWIDDVTNPGNRNAALKLAPTALEGIPVTVELASSTMYDNQPIDLSGININ